MKWRVINMNFKIDIYSDGANIDDMVAMKKLGIVKALLLIQR